LNRLRSVSPSCCLLVAILAALTPKANGESTPENYVAGALIQLNDNGAWSWFMDERVIIDRGKLIVGSVRAIKNFNEGKADPNWGNVELAVYDLATGKVEGTVLQPHYEQDDHNGPALYVRPDGRRLAVYTKHGVNLTINYRISEPGDPLRWSEAKSFETPGHAVHFGGDSVTYSNLFRLPNGRTYNFHRGVDHDPNYLVSTDDGQTWRYGGRLLHGRDRAAPLAHSSTDS